MIFIELQVFGWGNQWAMGDQSKLLLENYEQFSTAAAAEYLFYSCRELGDEMRKIEL